MFSSTNERTWGWFLPLRTLRMKTLPWLFGTGCMSIALQPHLWDGTTVLSRSLPGRDGETVHTSHFVLTYIVNIYDLQTKRMFSFRNFSGCDRFVKLVVSAFEVVSREAKCMPSL